MSELTKELRIALSADDHEFLDAVALGTREDKQAIARRLIHDFLDAKRHEYTVGARFLVADGIASESRRSRAGGAGK